MLEAIATYLLSNLDFKTLIMLFSAIYFGHRLKCIETALKECISADICNERHGGTCRRLNEVEKDVKGILKEMNK